MSQNPLPHGRYRHFKGGEYEVLGTAQNSETQEIYVVYKPLYNDSGWWIRPLKMFLETVEFEGKTVPRFAFVSSITPEDERSRLEEENIRLRSQLQTSTAFANLTRLPGLERVCRAIEQVASTDSTVLITGETGTGKELIAQAIHELSTRRGQSLIKVNCAALPKELIPSELFGHEAGAFTGAQKRRLGRFELAHRGTLFLDEIAEISPETQVLLLRVLQNRIIERIGSNEPMAIDVRLIAATNRVLSDEVQRAAFRADLFYRLNVFPIVVPPLRERLEDIPRLVDYFINQFNRRMNRDIKRVGSATLQRMLAYSWPGNVRELENLIERGFIITPGETLHIDPIWLEGPPPEIPRKPEAVSTWAVQEKQTLLDALKQARGKVYGSGGAAELLGLKPTTLYSKLRKHGIDRHEIEREMID